jgi:quinol monooxygenase YgiN
MTARTEETVSDLHVVAVLTAKPGSEATVREALEALVEPTRAESGNRGYTLFSSAADPTVFVTIENWASQADLDAHLVTPHIAIALQAASDHLATAPAIHPLVPID